MRAVSNRSAGARRLLVLVVLVVATVLGVASSAAAQEDPFVTNGPDQLGERVSESEQATQRLNLAVLGLLGLAGVIAASTVAFWRLSAPSLRTTSTVQPAFRIEVIPPGGTSAPAVGPGPTTVAPVPVAASAFTASPPATPSGPPATGPLVGPRPAADPFAAVQSNSGPPTVSVEDVSPGVPTSTAGSSGGSWASQGWGSDHGG